MSLVSENILWLVASVVSCGSFNRDIGDYGRVILMVLMIMYCCDDDDDRFGSCDDL